ncbi:uncharacterized protein LOC134270105 [Saccostrea cucullata]|uniref:uncharacterized protein LOC134270105 n=1 Tax=Saccostrea cuccullata TaxID=36930 RepID=UPI002ED4DEDA
MKVLIITLILFSKGDFAKSRCSGKDGLVCCSGTVWDNSKQECVECNPGYYGLNCTSVCQYPTYGKTCKFLCSCKKELCDIAIGCQIRKEENADRQDSKLEGEIVVSRESRKETSNHELEVSSLPVNGGKTFESLSIDDIKRIIKESDTLTWRLVFIIFASSSTCVTFTITCFVYKSCKPMERSKREQSKTSSVGSGEYTECELMELNIKTENIIFEGLVNAKIGHNATKNVYAIQLHGACPNSEVDPSAQKNEIKFGSSPQCCKCHSLSHEHGYVEPKIHDETSNFLRKYSDPENSVTDVPLLADEDRNHYLIVTK